MQSRNGSGLEVGGVELRVKISGGITEGGLKPICDMNL